MDKPWDKRYAVDEYIYGEAPNEFYAWQLSKLKPGKIILTCEGEGRNAVYAASLGWHVDAFDASKTGKAKALALANKKNVEINYIIADADTVSYPENSVDAVALIYAH